MAHHLREKPCFGRGGIPALEAPRLLGFSRRFRPGMVRLHPLYGRLFSFGRWFHSGDRRFVFPGWGVIYFGRFLLGDGPLVSTWVSVISIGVFSRGCISPPPWGYAFVLNAYSSSSVVAVKY